MRVLLKEEEPDEGTVQRGHLVELGYYDQHLKLLDPDKQVIRVWPEADPDAEEGWMRDLLGRFGLQGDIVYQQVGKLSGGERSRAARRDWWQGVNVLILDEPTNHLDRGRARRKVGAQGVRRHRDRGEPRPLLPQPVVDLLLVLDGRGGVKVIHGNYDTYEMMQAQEVADAKAKQAAREKAEKAAAKAAAPAATAGRGAGQGQAAETPVPQGRGHRGGPGGGGRVAELEVTMASPELYKDGEKVKATTRVRGGQGEGGGAVRAVGGGGGVGPLRGHLPRAGFEAADEGGVRAWRGPSGRWPAASRCRGRPAGPSSHRPGKTRDFHTPSLSAFSLRFEGSATSGSRPPRRSRRRTPARRRRVVLVGVHVERHGAVGDLHDHFRALTR